MLKDNEYVWYNDISKEFLSRDYLLPDQTLDERINIIAQNAQRILGIEGFADSFVTNMKKGWYSLSSPVWTNFGTNRGMPISCFGSNIEDDMGSILYADAEIGMMSKMGGGTSTYYGKLRSRGSNITGGDKSDGPIHFMRRNDVTVDVISQGSMRRGSCAVWLPVDHPDIMEYLTLRTVGSPIQNLSFGVVVPEGWMQAMIDGDKDKRKIWAAVIAARTNIGYPYVMFADNANKNTVDVYKDKKMRINHSNLCTEIMLPNNEEESFVCCLSSMNVLHFDDWKDTNAVEILTFFLDAVMSEFIEKTKNIRFMERPVRFAERHRALGIGQLGWHSYLQSKMIPFESMPAKLLNVKIAKTMKTQAYAASEKLATLFGEPELLIGYKRRNTTLLAPAPTKSSSFILGQVSEGIEAIPSNFYIKDLAKGKFTIKNLALKKLLEEMDKDTDDVWNSILTKKGSVQHLDFLSDKEKAVFKTFSEITPMEVVIQAAQRQKYIDQSQSLNLMIHPLMPTKDINALMIEAWKLGVKSLYYQIGINAAQEFSREHLATCVSCEA